MNPAVEQLQGRYYPNALQRDPVALFLKKVEADVQPEHTVLDIGAGAGARNRYQFRGKVKRMIGVDVDPRVADNPLLDDPIVSDGNTIPLPANSVNVAFSIYVQEHVEKPLGFANEIYRILQPGGTYLGLAPNRYHYVPAIAMLTPTTFHRWLNSKRGRPGEDTFETYYRLNTASAIERIFSEVGFNSVQVEGIEVEPQYLKFSKFSYLAGVAYERAVNSSEVLSRFRVNLITRATKPL